jgi:D-alanine-D-alanine ligase
MTARHAATKRSPAKPSVLVLGGGPDAEREVSLVSSRAVALALREEGHEVNYRAIRRATLTQLRAMQGEVVFPVLHGGWGEGGPLQDALERLGRPYVGCKPNAARLAMDKMGTKLAAASIGVATNPACVLNLRDPACPLDLPVVVKPVHEGSSVGVHICRTRDDWEKALRAVSRDVRRHPQRVYMVERAVLGGRELTVGVLDGEALPIIEIRPNVEFYDYEAKYNRDDTKYHVDPRLRRNLAETLSTHSVALARTMGVRHLCRVDFLLDRRGEAWLLEVNTMPGFTGHSLVPMAAAHIGIPMPRLCGQLVRMALRDHAPKV